MYPVKSVTGTITMLPYAIIVTQDQCKTMAMATDQPNPHLNSPIPMSMQTLELHVHQ
ncbi:hypothetical protein A2U01_0115613, partial [Trifolium medium]|nr:hypothetical protein [Trifolium medium]